jgi:hypothetical protein
MFGKIICEIIGSLSPMDLVLALVDLIFDPVKTHVHGFGTALFYCVIDDS